MAKIFVAVAPETMNEEFIIRMGAGKRVVEFQKVAGDAIDVEGCNFYCLDYGEHMKVAEAREYAKCISVQKQFFGDKGRIFGMMLAGNNVTMERFLNEIVEEVPEEESEDEESEDNNEAQDSSYDCEEQPNGQSSEEQESEDYDYDTEEQESEDNNNI